MGNEQASMKPFATLLQATVVVLAIVFVFATDVAADPGDGLPVEDLPTEAFPKVEDLVTKEGRNGEVNQRKGHTGASAALDQLQTNAQATTGTRRHGRRGRRRQRRGHNPHSHNPHRHHSHRRSEFSCGSQCMEVKVHVIRGRSHGIFCCTCEGGYKGWLEGWKELESTNTGGRPAYSKPARIAKAAAQTCMLKKLEWCRAKPCSGFSGEILAEKSSTASRKDSLDLEDLLTDFPGDNAKKEGMNSVADLERAAAAAAEVLAQAGPEELAQAGVGDAFCIAPVNSGWGR